VNRIGMWLYVVAFSAALFAASGCVTGNAAGSNSGAVHHVVVCWLKSPGDASARAQIIETSKSFSSIPGVLSVKAGSVIPCTRSMVDSTFDVAIVITFKDRNALSLYLDHPVHRRSVESVMKPLVGRTVIYDFSGDI